MATTNTVITDAEEFAEALFGLALGSTTLAAVQTDAGGSGGLNAFLDQIYTQYMGHQSSSSVANTIASNLGLTGSDFSTATALLTTALNAAAPGNTQGETLMSILNVFAGLTADPTWGYQATAWSNEISKAIAYGQGSVSNETMNAFFNPPGPGATLDISGFTGIHDLTSSNPAVSVLDVYTSPAKTTLLNLASAVTVLDNNSNDSSNLTLTHAGAGQSNAVTVDFNGGGSLTLNATGDATVTVNTSSAGHYADTFNLSENDNALTLLKFTGSDSVYLGRSTGGSVDGVAGYASSAISDIGASIPGGTTVASSLATIDASQMSGSINISAGDTLGSVSYGGLVIEGGTSGGDTITNFADHGSIIEGAASVSTSTYNTLTVYGANATVDDSRSAHNDHIFLDGVGDSALLGSGAVTVAVNNASFGPGITPITGTDSVTSGSGTVMLNDSLFLGTNANGNMLSLHGTLSNFSLTLGANDMATSLGAATSVAGAVSLDQAITQLTGQAYFGQFEWFQYGGNTYIEHSGSNYATSSVVMLTGAVDLSHVSVSNGKINL